MKPLKLTVAFVASLAVTAGGAHAAGYMKLGDIKGESTEAGDDKHDKWIDVLSVDWGAQDADGRHNAVMTVKEGEEPVLIGLLLPAVQKVRAAPSSSTGRSSAMRVSERLRHKGRMTYRETSRGRDVKTWVLHDAEFDRPRATGRAGATHRLRINYKCKDWTIVATGEKGGDCAAPARARKGNVETEFKVEKGE